MQLTARFYFPCLTRRDAVVVVHTTAVFALHLARLDGSSVPLYRRGQAWYNAGCSFLWARRDVRTQYPTQLKVEEEEVRRSLFLSILIILTLMYRLINTFRARLFKEKTTEPFFSPKTEKAKKKKKKKSTFQPNTAPIADTRFHSC